MDNFSRRAEILIRINSLLTQINNYNLSIYPGLINIEDIPRVTSILDSMMNEPALMNWANSLGFKHISYNKERERAASIGTQIHDIAEKIITNKIADEYKGITLNDAEATTALNSFLLWYNDIYDILHPIMIEQHMYHPAFRGTFDMICEINGKVYLVDFKTSNHIGYRYFLQLAAYRFLIKENFNIDLDGCLILQVSKKLVGFQEYILNFDNPNHLEFIDSCEESFLSLVYAYHHRRYIESQWNKLKL